MAAVMPASPPPTTTIRRGPVTMPPPAPAARGAGPRGRPVLVGGAEHTQREPADRARDAPAVVQQLVEGGVPGALHVGDAAVDDLGERLDRDREAAGRVVQRDQNRVPGGRA